MLFYEDHSVITELKLKVQHWVPASSKITMVMRGCMWSWFCGRSSSANPGSLSSRLRPSPPASATCPSTPPPPQGLGRGWGPDGSWGPSSILNAASSPPPTTLLHSWSYLHPLTPSSPSPIENPWAPALVSAAWVGKHSPSPKMHPMSLLCSCLG